MWTRALTAKGDGVARWAECTAVRAFGGAAASDLVGDGHAVDLFVAQTDGQVVGLLFKGLHHIPGVGGTVTCGIAECNDESIGHRAEGLKQQQGGQQRP